MVFSDDPVSPPKAFYTKDVEEIRDKEYPLLRDTVYLDHAGTTPYAKSLIETFSNEMTSNLFGNPHSASSSSQLSSRRIDDARLNVLRFFNASPEDFDVVFVANATAGIKLVAEALRDYDSRGFWYGYHVDSHTSLVGVRDMAEQGRRCFVNDEETGEWISGLNSVSSTGTESNISSQVPTLFAYPGQSNMTGRRLPLGWCKEIRNCMAASGKENVFSLLDAASLVSTSPLDLNDAASAPDFTVVSFYKIFGFPDLGALLVRKDAGHIFEKRKYFGGGTVGMVMSLGDQWHAKKASSVHEQVEDGTLPFHNIVALNSALDVHERLYGSMDNISRHTSELASVLFDRLASMKHGNGKPVCEVYKGSAGYSDRAKQGPLLSFNLKTHDGKWVRKSDVEKLAAVKNIQIRSGTLCNPGGMAYYLGLSPEEMRRNYNAGQRCGDDNDIIAGKPTGGLRASLGAMTSMKDIEKFIGFIHEFYVDTGASMSPVTGFETFISSSPSSTSRFYVEKLCVYPIKSCGAFVIPEGMQWAVKPEGLAWDREWCLIHQGTGVALNQKRYPRMALIRPAVDLERDVLRITCAISDAGHNSTIELPLSRKTSDLVTTELIQSSAKRSSTVCGDRVIVQVYSSPKVSSFFSNILDVPCTLARFPPQQSSVRYSKPYHQSPARQHDNTSAQNTNPMPGSFPESIPTEPTKRPILLSNESPMLLISRSSVNKVNETIKSTGKPDLRTKTVAADVFRANIVVAENLTPSPPSSLTSTSQRLVEQPYIEDMWTGFEVGNSRFDVLGSCQRCQMVCVNQFTAVRSDEPFSTLAKTRKIDGKVFFGRHVSLSQSLSQGTSCGDERESSCSRGGGGDGRWTVRVGDVLTPFYE